MVITNHLQACDDWVEVVPLERRSKARNTTTDLTSHWGDVMTLHKEGEKRGGLVWKVASEKGARRAAAADTTAQLPLLTAAAESKNIQLSRMRACVKGAAVATLVSSACFSLLLYFFSERMDVLFVLRHGSIGFPPDGSIEANVTLSGQVVPGEFFSISPCTAQN